MIDRRHPLVVLVARLPWQRIEQALAPKFAHQDRPAKQLSSADLLGQREVQFGGGVSNAATLVDPPHGQPAVPEELVQPQRRRTRAALERERVLPVLQRAGVLRAAAALRCDADRAPSACHRQGRPGATAQGHDRDGRADRGRQARRVGERDCRHHGAGEGHRAPGGQPLAGDRPPQGGQRSQASRHRLEADFCEGGQGAAPQGRWLRARQAVPALEENRQAPAHDPRRGDARSAAQARRRQAIDCRRRRANQ